MRFAIYYTKPGTMLTFWLNRYSWGGFIWSLVRTSEGDRSIQRWTQPPLRFDSKEAADAFIATELAGNELARATPVTD